MMDYRKILLALTSALLVASMISSIRNPKVHKVNFYVPPGWPQPHYDFSKNQLTREGFLLGNVLFFDPILSKDNSVSCGSCHLSFSAFTHADHNLSHGIYGRIGKRNSSALMNLAWSNSFLWDGGVNNIEVQPINPITNPDEMDNSINEVVRRLNNSKEYKKLFYQAFGDSTVTSQRLLKALAQFTLMLNSYNSKYDSVMRKEKNVSFSPLEEEGYSLYKKNCSSCHAEPLFTNNSFQNNGLPLDTALKDYGRYSITHKSEDSLKFKIPTLRNIEYSGPYFHDGRARKLKDVLEHYSNGITDSKTLAPELRNNITLKDSEKKALIAFLKTLTDKTFLYNVRYRFDYPQKAAR